MDNIVDVVKEKLLDYSKKSVVAGCVQFPSRIIGNRARD